MEQALLVAGALVFGALGAIHLFYTFRTNKFEAFDPAVTAAMKSTSPILTRETTVWRAWIGFNASHSLGAILVAAIYVPLALFHIEVLQRSTWLSVLPALLGLVYAVLARKYWFKIPFIGVLMATVCFGGAALLING